MPYLAAKRKSTTLENLSEAPATLTDHPFYGLDLDSEQQELVNTIWDPHKLIVFVNAVAGTGKTTIAMGVANLLVKYGKYDGILGIVSPCEETRQGYLPGDIKTKSEVYFEPFYQAMITCNMNPMTDISDEALVNEKNGTAFVKLITHTYTRGSTFDHRVVIIDEAQNFAFRDLKKVLTRCTDDCKVIVLGHDGQCDLENPSQSGFVPYMEHFRGDSRCSICTLTTNHRGWVSSWADALPNPIQGVREYRTERVSGGSL